MLHGCCVPVGQSKDLHLPHQPASPADSAIGTSVELSDPMAHSIDFSESIDYYSELANSGSHDYYN